MGFFKPSPVGKDCDKAAEVLKSFTALANAHGLAIFTGFRAGMYFAGARGSGVVVARLPDRSWSPPSAFSLRSGSLGLVYGVDVYDCVCVCVLNTLEAVRAYAKAEVRLGGAVALAAGPVSIPTQTRDVKPVWVYAKSWGFNGGLTVDGTVISQRGGANAEFYGGEVESERILKGEVEIQREVTKWPAGAAELMEVLKLAEGKIADLSVIEGVSSEPTPGDLEE